MGLQRIPRDEATIEQLIEFIEISNLEITSQSSKRSREDLYALMDTAQIGREGIVISSVLAPASVDTEDLLDREDWDEGKERWGLIRLQLDEKAKDDGGDRLSAVFVGVNEESIYLPRALRILVRERFIHNLMNAVVMKKVQGGENAEGKAMKFSEAKVVPTQTYPMNFYGWKGYVRDGVPKGLPPDVKVCGGVSVSSAPIEV